METIQLLFTALTAISPVGPPPIQSQPEIVWSGALPESLDTNHNNRYDILPYQDPLLEKLGYGVGLIESGVDAQEVIRYLLSQGVISELVQSIPPEETQVIRDAKALVNDPYASEQQIYTSIQGWQTIEDLFYGRLTPGPNALPTSECTLGIIDGEIAPHEDLPSTTRTVYFVDDPLTDHATAMAGAANAIAENGIAISSIGGGRVSVENAVIVGRDGSSYVVMARAITDLVENGACAISISMGSEGQLSPLQEALLRDAFNSAQKKGVMVFISAGNAGLKEGCNASLACLDTPNTYITAASTLEGDWWTSSNVLDGMGPRMYTLPTGSFTPILSHDGTSVNYSVGTSLGPPILSVFYASMKQLGVPAEAFFSALTLTARDIDTEGVDHRTGHGVIDVDATVRVLIEEGYLVKEHIHYLPNIHKQTTGQQSTSGRTGPADDDHGTRRMQENDLWVKWWKMERRKAAKNQTSKSATISS